jgi:hypothetical protein
MARTIAQIQSEMDTEQALQTGLSDLNSPSQVAIYTLWKYVISASIWAHEKLWDIFKLELEAIVDAAPIGTDGWVQSQSLLFQYSATDPQVITLVDFVPAYSVVDTDLQIITRCSVKTLPNKTVNVKVAKSDPPSALTATELSSFAGYLDDISFAGVQYNAISLASDKLYLDAEVFYNGQYSSVISDTVIAAVNDYLANIPFDGNVRVSALYDAIQNVSGVTDVIINDMAIRADATAFGSKTYLVQNNTTIYNKYPTFAGYVVEETTVSNTFVDKLTFTPES